MLSFGLMYNANSQTVIGNLKGKDADVTVLNAKISSVSNVTNLKAVITSNIAYMDGSNWVKRSGSKTNNGGVSSGTIIRVDATNYWERVLTGNIVTPQMFGAIENDGLDDTYSFQLSINYLNSIGGGTLNIPSGTFNLLSLTYYEGISFQGQQGTILKKIVSTDKFSRMFTLPANYTLSGEGKTTSFKDIKFDGNRINHGSYTNFELEHSHMIFTYASNNSAGKFNLVVENCRFNDIVADGICAHTNVNLKVNNCNFENVFRGGTTITGGNSISKISNCDYFGSVHPSCPIIEVDADAPGINNSFKVIVTYTNITYKELMNVSFISDSEFYGTNIVCTGQGFNFGGGANSIGKISNSKLVFGSGDATLNRFYAPNNLSFENCEIITKKTASTPNYVHAGIPIYWNISGFPTVNNQSLKFNNCRFSTMGKQSGDNFWGIYSNDCDISQRVIVDNCTFDDGFDYAIHQRGGKFYINNCLVKNPAFLYLNYSPSTNSYTSIDGLKVESPVLKFANIVTSHPNQVVKIQNTEILPSQSTITTDYGMAGNTQFGGRKIIGNTNPTGLSGFKGDIYTTTNIQSGMPYTWICTNSGIVGTWVVLSNFI